MRQTMVYGTVAACALAMQVSAAEVAPGDVQFVDGAIEQSLTGVAGDAARGEKIMTTNALGNCVACHASEALNAYPYHGNIGPALDGAADRWTEAQLRGLIVNAKMTFDGTFMPAFYKSAGFIRIGNAYTGRAPEDPASVPPILTAQQVEDVVAFLMTLKE
jgi:sulfur-oxidizing protein SoxX